MIRYDVILRRDFWTFDTMFLDGSGGKLFIGLLHFIFSFLLLNQINLDALALLLYFQRGVRWLGYFQIISLFFALLSLSPFTCPSITILAPKPRGLFLVCLVILTHIVE